MGYRLQKDGFLGREAGYVFSAEELRAAFEPSAFGEQAYISRRDSMLRQQQLAKVEDPKPKAEEAEKSAIKATTTKKPAAKKSSAKKTTAKKGG